MAAYDTFVGLPADQSISGATWDAGGMVWGTGGWLAGNGANGVKSTQVDPYQGIANYLSLAGQIGQRVFFKIAPGRQSIAPAIVLYIDGGDSVNGNPYLPSSVRVGIGAYNQLILRDMAASTETQNPYTIADNTEYCLELVKTTNANGKEYKGSLYASSGQVAGALLVSQTITLGAAMPGTNRQVQIAGTSSQHPLLTINRVEAVDAPAADTTKPVLSNPTVGAIGTTTVNAIVSTDEGGGTMYARVLPSASAAPDATTIEASGVAQAVTATGTRTIPVTGLTQGTSYRPYFVQVDAAGNTSDVVTGAPFTTLSVDSQAPTFSAGAVITPGAITSSSVTATGPTATDNVGVAGYEKSKDGGTTWVDNGTGTSFNFQGLPADTNVVLGWRAYDAQNNKAAPVTLTMRTAAAPASSAGTITWPYPIAPVNGDARLSAGHRIAVCNMTTDALVVKKTGLVTHATTGVPPAISDALIVSGTQYRCHLILDSDNTASGTEVITAT